MKHFFKELFQYSTFFNRQLIDKMIQKQDQLSEKSLKVMSHMLNAHHVWNARIENKKSLFGIWQIHTIEELMEIELSNSEMSLAILEKYDLDEIIHYTNTTGIKFENSVRDILFHVINHTTYHRGQIATDFRQNNIEPILTEYIYYKSLKE